MSALRVIVGISFKGKKIMLSVLTPVAFAIAAIAAIVCNAYFFTGNAK